MTPIKQTIFGPRGNCAPACLASLLELSLDEVPYFGDVSVSDADWWNAFYAFINARNLTMWHIAYPSHEHALLDLKHRPGYLLVWGESPRGNCHYVIFHRGEMVHDPHPEGGGLSKIGGVDVLYPIDPARGH